MQHQRSQTLGGGSFNKKAFDKIQMLNSQQQAEARKQLQSTSFDLGVTYKNLDEREDMQDTLKKSNMGPRFSDQLMSQKQRSRSRSGSPEKFHVPPTYENKTRNLELDHLKKKSELPSTPDEQILKPENFIKQLLAASEDPAAQNELLGNLRQMNEAGLGKSRHQRSSSQQDRGMPADIYERTQFENFIQNYDSALHQELKNRRGLSPQEVRAHKERVEDLKRVEAFIQTIKAQDKELPEYLRAGQKQRDHLESKFKDRRVPYHSGAPSGFQGLSSEPFPVDELNMSREGTQDVKIMSNGFDMRQMIPKSVDLTDHSIKKMLRTSQGFFRPDMEEMEEHSPPRQSSLDQTMPPSGKNRFDQVQRTYPEGPSGETVKIMNKKIGSPDTRTRNMELDQSQIDLNDRANATALEIPETSMMKKDINQIMQSRNELRPVSPPQALREYQIFKNFEDPEFYNEGSNIDKIVDELDKMDKFASIKWDEKVLGVNENGIQIDTDGKAKPPMMQKSPPVSPQNKAKNPTTTWTSDPQMILKSGLNNQTLVADELQRCLDQQKGLQETRARIDTEMREGVKSPSDIDSLSGPKSVITRSRQSRQSIVKSLEHSQKVKLESEKAAQIQAQALRQKQEIEEARSRASGDKEGSKKKRIQPTSYSTSGPMSDELRMKTVFSNKLMKLLYTN